MCHWDPCTQGAVGPVAPRVFASQSPYDSWVDLHRCYFQGRDTTCVRHMRKWLAFFHVHWLLSWRDFFFCFTFCLPSLVASRVAVPWHVPDCSCLSWVAFRAVFWNDNFLFHFRYECKDGIANHFMGNSWSRRPLIRVAADDWNCPFSRKGMTVYDFPH